MPLYTTASELRECIGSLDELVGIPMNRKSAKLLAALGLAINRFLKRINDSHTKLESEFLDSQGAPLQGADMSKYTNKYSELSSSVFEYPMEKINLDTLSSSEFEISPRALIGLHWLISYAEPSIDTVGESNEEEHY